MRFRDGHCPYMTPGRCAEVNIGENGIGYMGQLHPEVADVFSIAGEFYIAELALEPLLDAAGSDYKYRPVGRFPSVKVDIAVVVEEALASGNVEDAIKGSGGEFLESVTLFDVYHGHQIPQGKKSLAYALEFGSADRTLTDGETHVQLERIINTLGEEFGAQIRGREQDQGDSA